MSLLAYKWHNPTARPNVKKQNKGSLSFHDIHTVIFLPQGTEEVDSAPGAPQERINLLDSHAYVAEVKELQRRYFMDQIFLMMRNRHNMQIFTDFIF